MKNSQNFPILKNSKQARKTAKTLQEAKRLISWLELHKRKNQTKSIDRKLRSHCTEDSNLESEQEFIFR
jgi:hypothetical protein